MKDFYDKREWEQESYTGRKGGLVIAKLTFL